MMRDRTLWLVVVLAVALCVPWLDRPFHTRGEPREALVAQAMLATGNWISPPSYDGAVPSKPPFSHWLMALASLPQGGVSEATSRLPSACAFVFFSAAFFCFVKRRISESAALGASLILLSSSEWFRSASTCRVDMILATSMAGALYALYAWWERGYRGVPLTAWILIAIAALTKGPVGIVLPLSIFSLFCWFKTGCSLRSIVEIALRGASLAVPCILVVSIWYVLGYRERGDAFLEKVMYENFARFTSTMADEPHKHSVLYLLGMLYLGLLPWTIPLVVQAVVSMRGSGWRGRRLAEGWRGLSDLHQFAFLSAAIIILFFCIPSSKRSVYLLPAYPSLAILLELMVRQSTDRLARLWRVLSRVVVGITIATCVVAVGLMVSPSRSVRLDWAAFLYSLTSVKLISSAMIVLAIVWPLRSIWYRLTHSGVSRLGLAMISAVFVISFLVYDTVATQLSPKRWLLSEEFREAVDLDQSPTTYSFGSEMYGASFYLQRNFSRTIGAAPSRAVIFMEHRRIDEYERLCSGECREVARYASGLQSPSRDLVVLESTSSLQD